jgi:hypothetical protein
MKNMRTCFSFFLAIMLSLNASYAASVGVCDAMEHTPGHTAHIGHHSHEHSDDHDVPSSDAAATDKVHYHDHAHSSFSSILPGIIDVIPLTGCSPQVAAPAGTFVSTPQVLLDRPPRTTLA